MTDEELDRHVTCWRPHRGGEQCDWCDVDALVIKEWIEDREKARAERGEPPFPAGPT